jgi:hypothetical protein
MYETIAQVADPAVARVLVAALRGYGFHPLARDDEGVFGMASLATLKGAPIEVPVAEAAEARALADALLKDMLVTGPRPAGR